MLRVESCIKSNTAHGILKLDEEVPQTVISRERLNISQFFLETAL